MAAMVAPRKTSSDINLPPGAGAAPLHWPADAACVVADGMEFTLPKRRILARGPVEAQGLRLPVLK